MSQIFDALQRSESERSGNDTPAMSRATELLRRTESYAASKWETAALGEEQDSIEGEEHGASREFQTDRPTISYKDVIATENWPLDQRIEDAGQFQSLSGRALSSKPAGLPAGQRQPCDGSLSPSRSALAAPAYRKAT